MSGMSSDLLKAFGVLLAAHPAAEQTGMDGKQMGQQSAPATPPAPQSAQPSGSAILEASGAQVPPEEAASMTIADQAISRGKKEETKAQNELQKGATAEQVGIQSVADIESQKAEAALPLYEEQAIKLNTFEDQFGKTLDKAHQRIESQWGNYLSAVDEYKNTHIYDWWQKATTGAKVLGLISQALAGGLQGFKGTSGPTPLDKIIEEDRQVQVANLEQKDRAANQAGQLYGVLRTNLKDEVVVHSAVSEIAYNSFLHRLDAVAARMASPAAQAKAQELKGQVQNRLAQLKAQTYMGFSSNIMSEEMREAGIPTAYGELLWGKENKPMPGVAGIPGSEALGEGDRTALAGRVGNIKSASEAAGQLKTLLKDGKYSSGLDFYKKHQQLFGELRTLTVQALTPHGRQPSDVELKQADSMIGESFWSQFVSSKDAQSQLDHYLNFLKTLRKNTVESYSVNGQMLRESEQ